MNKIELCLQNKIANSSKLRPTILKAILNLYNRGIRKMTAEMVKNECLVFDISKPWNERIPAICLSMKNATECGGRIIGEYREINGFTIAFDGNGNNLEISTPKKTSAKTQTNKKEETNSSSIPTYTNEIEIEKLNLSKNFKVVMICAGGKNDSFFTAYPNENFVNNQFNNFEHHPDEIMNDGITPWREYLNKNQSDANLKKAYELYKPKKTGIYTRMYNKYLNRFFILSAGWGLVKSDFKLPNYDITFSTDKKSPINTRRNQNINMLPIYSDFNQLIININDDIVYVGGQKYLKLFYKLTRNLPNRKIIYYNSKNNPKPLFGNYLYRRYFIKYSTNWHYELAEKIANGIIP